jgi:AcrR family transcriptional regulator
MSIVRKKSTAVSGVGVRAAAKQRTRASLLNAAEVVFRRDGYRGATLADIGAWAGVTTGAVYVHFSGKAELFLAVAARRSEAQMERLVDGVDIAADGAADDAWTAATLEFWIASLGDPKTGEALRAQHAEFVRTFSRAIGTDDDTAALLLALGDGLVLHEQMGFIDSASRLLREGRHRLRTRSE